MAAGVEGGLGYKLEPIAQFYVKYRPTWPPELYDQILSYLDQGHAAEGPYRRRRTAIDAGCGAGQSTLALAQYFESVVGLDSSEAQLVEARRVSGGHTNVSYRACSAEELSSVVEPDSVDLITAGIALHWFDLNRFYGECLRVLKTGGVFAAYAYQLPRWHNTEADQIIHKLLRETMKDYWPPGASHVFSYYEEPFDVLKEYFQDPVRNDSMEIKFNCSLEEVIGFIKSFPVYHYYKADHPEHPDEIDLTFQKLMNIYETVSANETVASGSSSVLLIMGRKSSSPVL